MYLQVFNTNTFFQQWEESREKQQAFSVHGASSTTFLHLALAFVPLLMSSSLTKIGIIVRGKIFPVTPRSDVIGSMKPEICMKVLRNLIDKLRAAHLRNAF